MIKTEPQNHSRTSLDKFACQLIDLLRFALWCWWKWRWRWGRWAYRVNNAGKIVMFSPKSHSTAIQSISLRWFSFCASFVVYQFSSLVHRFGSLEFALNKKNSPVLLQCISCFVVVPILLFRSAFFLYALHVLSFCRDRPNQYIMCIM